MPIIIEASDSKGFLHEPDEWYSGQLIFIEEQAGEYGPSLKWIIHLDGDISPIDDEQRETWAYCSQKLSPRSRLYGWVKGITGEAPEPGTKFDVESLVGARIQVMFEEYPGFDADGNPTTKEKVAKIRAEKGGNIRSMQKRAAAAKQPASDDPERPF